MTGAGLADELSVIAAAYRSDARVAWQIARFVSANMAAILAALREERPDAEAGALTALRAVMSLNSVQTLFEAAEEYPHGPEDVAAEMAALKLARSAMARERQ